MKIIVDWLVKEKYGEEKAWWYGFSYSEENRACDIYYPYPLNWIIRYSLKLYWRFLRAFYWIGLIDVKVGESFHWDTFFRIKTH